MSISAIHPPKIQKFLGGIIRKMVLVLIAAHRVIVGTLEECGFIEEFIDD